PAIERKLAELVRRHGARQARYWGQTRVLLQQLLTGWVVNMKRIVRLLTEPHEPQTGTLRAGGGASGERGQRAGYARRPEATRRCQSAREAPFGQFGRANAKWRHQPGYGPARVTFVGEDFFSCHSCSSGLGGSITVGSISLASMGLASMS